MTPWLLSIVGITVVGVLIELLLTDSPMSKFVRSIYAFFILFVIVQPIPGFLKNGAAAVSGEVFLNTPLLETINAQTRAALQARTTEVLDTAGYNCIVTIFGDKVYINASDSTKKDAAAIISIVTAVCNVRPEAVEVYA